MNYSLAFAVVLALLVVSEAQINCKFNKCLKKGLEHTMCKYKSRSPSRDCGTIEYIGITTEERKEIVKMHNDLRKHVAAGLEKRGSPGPQPAAERMPVLIWDVEIAEIAKRWAYQCKFGHDTCRDVDRFPVGQNVGVLSTTAEKNESTAKQIVQMWYDEVAHMDRNQVSKFTDYEKVGHYTQMVWAKTSRIGCAKIIYRVDGWSSYYLVCNYGPAGNMLGSEVYKAK